LTPLRGPGTDGSTPCSGVQGRSRAVEGLGEEVSAEAGGLLLHNKNRICDVKMYLNVNFCKSFVRTRNTVSRAKIQLSLL